MRSLIIFLVVSALHFLLSAIGIVSALPAAFDAQDGSWAAPWKAILAWMPTVLLAPLAWIWPLLPEGLELGFAEIAVVSALFGAAAVGLFHLWSAPRSRPRKR